jgi:hypothetical protein
MLRIIFASAIVGLACFSGFAQNQQHPRKQLLAIGEEKGYRHEAVSHALSTIERLGRETGLWDTFIRTDTEALTKQLPPEGGRLMCD